MQNSCKAKNEAPLLWTKTVVASNFSSVSSIDMTATIKTTVLNEPINTWVHLMEQKLSW